MSSTFIKQEVIDSDNESMECYDPYISIKQDMPYIEEESLDNNDKEILSDFVMSNVGDETNLAYCFDCQQIFEGDPESHQCHETITNQRYTNYDIIIEDEGMTYSNGDGLSNIIKLYVCSYCTKFFSHYENVLHHMETHKDENNKYSDPSIIISNGDNQNENSDRNALYKQCYACEYCDKTFIKKNYLQMHALVHSADKPFSCSKCDRQFPRKNALIRHELLHMNKKAYVCNICNKRFIQSSDLNRHRSTHFDARPYECDSCDKAYKILNSLSKHKSRKHGKR